MDIKALGKTHQLSDCELTRIDIDDEHYYYVFDEQFPDGAFCASVTHILDIAAPVDFGLRNFWKTNTKEEGEEVFEAAGKRGTKLHKALQDLMDGLEIDLTEDHWTQYEKDAITTFISFFRFLNPTAFKSEKVIASPKLRLAGTLDFVGMIDPNRLRYLLDGTKCLNVDDQGNLAIKDKFKDEIDKMPGQDKCVIDWKFSSGIRYSHGKQVTLYKNMYNESYKDEQPITRGFVWRYSPRHKLGFELKEITDTWESCMNIYNTYLDMNGGELPEPPELKVYPDKVTLLKEIEK